MTGGAAYLLTGTPVESIMGFLMAFVVGSSIAALYVGTFQGLSFSKSFVHSLVLSPIVTAIAMMAIDGSLARGIGMMGAFSILRFRSNIRDPRDMFFLFASLALGISCGVGAIAVSFLGLSAFVGTILILSKVPFTQTARFDGVLKFSLQGLSENKSAVSLSLEKICKRYSLVAMRQASQGDLLNYVYHVKIKKIYDKNDLVTELKEINGVSGISILVRDQEVEM